MRHNLLRFILLPAMLFFVYSAFAQDVKRINGKIEDSTTGYPLPYASVLLINSSFSNVTNSDGEFSLNVPSSNLKDSLLISYLGYKNLKVPVSDFIGKKNKRVKLEPTSIDIRSITVRTDDAAELFKSTFSGKSVRANYPLKATGMSGFYREIIKKGSKYLSLSEAIVDIYKQSYSNSFGDNISIYKGRGNTNRNASDTLFLQLQGGPVTSLQMDIVKNPFIDVDLLTATDYYDFTLGQIMFMDYLNI